MTEKKKHIFKYIFLFFVFMSYIIGFFLRENIAGGAESDFEKLTWPLILAFKNQIYDTLVNYGSFREGSLPVFHLFNAYLNPFTFSKITFQASITFFSILNVIFFSQIIREKFKISNLDSFVYASIFLLLPFFRSSAYWGLTENFGWLFLILSIKYFLKYENTSGKNSIYLIFLFCLFSSIALYTRPYLIFLPSFIFLKYLFYRDYFSLKYSSIFYLLFSLPGLYLLYLWGGSLKIGPQEVSLIQDYHNPKFILKNLIIFASIFLFYFFPWELSNLIKKVKLPNLKNLLTFLIILIFLFILYFLNIFDYLKSFRYGGGAIFKINQILFKDKFIFFILLSSFGITLIVDYIKISKKNIILFFCLLLFCFPKYILQEYFEPLFIILLFTLIDLRKNNLLLIKENNTMFIYCVYFLTYLLGSYYYRFFL